MKINYNILIFCFLLIACQPPSENLPGKYYSIRYNYLERPFESFAIRNDFLAVGTTLDLNEDSSFVQTTCGAIITGSWHTLGDSLYLEVDEITFKVDSIQKARQNDLGYQLPKKSIVFVIKKNELHQQSVMYDSDSNKIVSHHNLMKDNL